MKKLFSTSLLILAGMLLLLGSCKEDELPVSGEGNVANNELPVRLAETDYNPDNTYYLLNDNESQDVYFDSGQRSFYVSRPLQFGMDDEHCFQLRFYSPRALKNVTFWARITVTRKNSSSCRWKRSCLSSNSGYTYRSPPRT